MTAYIIMYKEDFENSVSAIFLDKKKAEAYLIKKAVEDMDWCGIANENRTCEYYNGDLTEIYDDSYYCYWWIEEHTIEED